MLTHRGREAAERVVLPTEHHGACWELLSAAARDVLACRQGEALGGHRSDCVGQRDRSLVHLQKRDPELWGGHSAGPELRQSRWASSLPFSSWGLPTVDPAATSCPNPQRVLWEPRRGFIALSLIHHVAPGKVLPFSGLQCTNLYTRAKDASPNGAMSSAR